MKLMTHKTFLMILATFSLAIMVSPLAAEVYKIVDKDGNVTYTDKPPADGSKPMDLPPLSVIETPVYGKTPRQEAEEAAAAGGTKEVPLRTLRNNFRDFAIISPLQEESVWRPEGPISIAWSSSNQLLEGMRVQIFLDGQQQADTTAPMIPVSGLDRGEHTVTAQIKDTRNRTIATAEPITFYVRQPGLSNRVRPAPSGGG
ncbi:DUF4124 domain-containing protein [Pseudomonadota bacterium]